MPLWAWRFESSRGHCGDETNSLCLTQVLALSHCAVGQPTVLDSTPSITASDLTKRSGRVFRFVSDEAESVARESHSVFRPGIALRLGVVGAG